MAKIVWCPTARADLDAIAAYIAKDSPARAAVFADRLIDAAERLADFPQSGLAIPEIGDPASREIPLGAYRILYHVESAHVIIVAIVHGARQWPVP